MPCAAQQCLYAGEASMLNHSSGGFNYAFEYPIPSSQLSLAVTGKIFGFAEWVSHGSEIFHKWTRSSIIGSHCQVLLRGLRLSVKSANPVSADMAGWNHSVEFMSDYIGRVTTLVDAEGSSWKWFFFGKWRECYLWVLKSVMTHTINT